MQSSNTSKIGILCICWFYSQGICQDARSYDRKSRFPLYRRLGGPHSRSGQERKISSSIRIRSPDRPARSQSLYRLRYLGSREQIGPHKICKHVRDSPEINVLWGIVMVLKRLSRQTFTWICYSCLPFQKKEKKEAEVKFCFYTTVLHPTSVMTKHPETQIS